MSQKDPRTGGHRPMFLSQVDLNPKSPATDHLLADADQQHKLMMAAVGARNEERPRVLFRRDHTHLTVLSENPPDWHAAFLSRSEAVLGVPAVKMVDRSPPPTGSRILFSLRLYTARRHGERQIMLDGIEAIREFAVERTAAHGLKCKPEDLVVRETGAVILMRRRKLEPIPLDNPNEGGLMTRLRKATEAFKKGVKRVSYPYSDLIGVGEVADPQSFATALTNGVGRHKCYGLGLLLIQAVV